MYKGTPLETNLSQCIVATTSDLSNIKIPLKLTLMPKIIYALIALQKLKRNSILFNIKPLFLLTLHHTSIYSNFFMKQYLALYLKHSSKEDSKEFLFPSKTSTLFVKLSSFSLRHLFSDSSAFVYKYQHTYLKCICTCVYIYINYK